MAELYLDFVLCAILCKIYNIIVDANCSKMLTVGIVTYSEAKKIIYIKSNVNISVYSYEPLL